MNKTKKRKNFIIILIIIVCATLLVSAILFVRSGSHITDADTNIDIEKTIAKLSKIMILPENETPSVATVLDKDKLSDQAFFANAQNDDQMIIYTNARKAILFRPSINKIVEVMPLLIDSVESDDSLDLSTTTIETDDASTPSFTQDQ